MTGGEPTSRYEDIKTQLDRLLDSTEKLAIASVQLTERMVGVNERVIRTETGLEKLLAETRIIDSPIHKADICPYQQKLHEYDRVIFGEKDFEGLSGRMTRLEKTVNRWKGAVGVVTAVFLAVLPTAIMLTYYLAKGK